MAKEKMTTKSPASKVASFADTGDSSLSATVERRTRMAARRRLLTNPDLPSTSTSSSSKSCTAKFFTSKEQDRREMIGELYKLSKSELAQPTRYERTKVRRGRAVKDSEEKVEGEGGAAKSPKLREFGAFEFLSPTKKEAAASRYAHGWLHGYAVFVVFTFLIIIYLPPSLSSPPPHIQIGSQHTKSSTL